MIDGLVVLDKEAGWTSHDVVARCRGIIGQRRVGHAGTLDPDATGVLLVGLGRATRLMRYLSGLPKHYLGEVILGVATSTLDASGEVTGRWEMSSVSLADMEEAAADLTGPILQVPPMVSAIKVGGRRLHELARAGIEVEREARPVVVHRLVVRPTGEPSRFGIDVKCSSGTYVRTLAADLGTALGGGAHLAALRRLSVGSFSVEESTTIEGLAADPAARVLSPAQAMRDLASVPVDGELCGPISHGAVLDGTSLGVHANEAGPWALLDGAGSLLAVYERCGDGQGRVKPAVVLSAP
ncbi:MAG: tRNA pseudouridine(55) synthase TruB [Acidimicrobiales bacterium]